MLFQISLNVEQGWRDVLILVGMMAWFTTRSNELLLGLIRWRGGIFIIFCVTKVTDAKTDRPTGRSSDRDARKSLKTHYSSSSLAFGANILCNFQFCSTIFPFSIFVFLFPSGFGERKGETNWKAKREAKTKCKASGFDSRACGSRNPILLSRYDPNFHPHT